MNHNIFYTLTKVKSVTIRHTFFFFKYLLKNYGNDYANKFIEECAEKDIKFSIEAYPHCNYAEGQCDIFCNFYKKGQCLYEN